jgi:hypothetical protein
MLTGVAHAEDVEEGPAPDLPKFTVSSANSINDQAVYRDALKSSASLHHGITASRHHDNRQSASIGMIN